MDPQQRLLLEVGSQALVEAGLLPSAQGRPAATNSTGVYVGIAASGYGELVQVWDCQHA